MSTVERSGSPQPPPRIQNPSAPQRGGGHHHHRPQASRSGPIQQSFSQAFNSRLTDLHRAEALAATGSTGANSSDISALKNMGMLGALEAQFFSSPVVNQGLRGNSSTAAKKIKIMPTQRPLTGTSKFETKHPYRRNTISFFIPFSRFLFPSAKKMSTAAKIGWAIHGLLMTAAYIAIGIASGGAALAAGAAAAAAGAAAITGLGYFGIAIGVGIAVGIPASGIIGLLGKGGKVIISAIKRKFNKDVTPEDRLTKAQTTIYTNNTSVLKYLQNYRNTIAFFEKEIKELHILQESSFADDTLKMQLKMDINGMEHHLEELKRQFSGHFNKNGIIITGNIDRNSEQELYDALMGYIDMPKNELPVEGMSLDVLVLKTGTNHNDATIEEGVNTTSNAISEDETIGLGGPKKLHAHHHHHPRTSPASAFARSSMKGLPPSPPFEGQGGQQQPNPQQQQRHSS